ncbi:RNA 2'-phosphotransferase [Paraburkholderia metrosideri]|uniref:Probable RNA 2'-phosphotransferase n=1 Tax=Paraburkholderia metrosideri TaxID=580937 RepID=A0ABN7HUU1_9BURK|nr:RNA 2'-phosphotransferase [Paraburkholderia metrosideri]CAD6538906.1 putative RNA 2'-phosphotransferase [Paraburkholderia metrosideri]
MNMKTDTHLPTEHLAVSRLLSKILRHEPELIGIKLDSQGWVSVDELTRAIERTARTAGASKRLRTLPTITKEVIQAVVATSDKRRFTLSSDGTRIRAAQGHSIEVSLGYAVNEPPAVLYHGTAWSNWKSIAVEGLTAQTRHAVHLSTDAETATRVGARHGQPLVLVVDAARMHADGYAFSRSDNGVWLVEEVPAAYLAQLGPRGHGSKS